MLLPADEVPQIDHHKRPARPPAGLASRANTHQPEGPAGDRSGARKTPEMPERGLEPPPSYLDKNLNLARLPIPPLGQVATFAASKC